MIMGVTSIDQGIPSASGAACTQGLIDSLVAYVTLSGDEGAFELHLDTSGTNIVRATPLSSLVEPTDAAYSPVVLTYPADPYTDQQGNAYYPSQIVDFAPGADGPAITGWFVTGILAGGVAATATATEAGGAVTGGTVTAGGGPYAIPPVVTVTLTPGGTRVARMTAVLTGGVVTSLTVVDGGAGYTGAPTITIAPPQSLQGGGTFTSPVPWTPGTNLPIVQATYAGSALPVAAA